MYAHRFGRLYAHHQELETLEMFTAHGTCCSSNIPQPGHITYSNTPHLQPTITKVMCHMLCTSV